MFRRMRRILVFASVALGLAIGSARAQPYVLEAREDTAVGSRPGTLRIGDPGVVFQAKDTTHGRRWGFDDVRQFRIESSHRIVVETYRSRGWLGLGRSRTYEYATVEVIPPELVSFLMSRVTKPVVTAVLPPRGEPARFTAAVLHEGTDTAGSLALYGDGLAFETPRDGYARFWRFADLDTVLRQDTYRLYVGAYEGPRERVRPFLFTLKSGLPPSLYDALWARINDRTLATARTGSR